MVVRILGLTRAEEASPREITRNNLLSESGGESGWLIRFFDSSFFCEWIAVSYLYKHDHPGVRDYVCNRMYTLPLSGIESYLFQICYMLVHKPSPSLDKFVIDICSKSLKIALKVQWFLMAELEDSDDNEGISRIQEKCQIAATIMGEWTPLSKPHTEPTNNIGKNQVLTRLLSSKQRLLSLATSPPPSKSFSFTPGANPLQEEGSSKASPDDSTIFKKFIPSPKVRNALLFRKSADKDDEESDKDGFFKRLLRDGKDEDEPDKDGFFKRLLRDGKDDDEPDKDGFFKRLLRDSKDEEREDEDKEKDGFFRRLLKDSKDEDEVATGSDKFFKRLFRDSKGDVEEKSVSKSVEGDDKDGFFRKLFRDKSEEKEKVTNSVEDEEKDGFFRKLFRDKNEEEEKGHANGVEEDSSDVPLFRRLFRMQSDDNKTAVPNESINGGGLESSPGTEIFFHKLFRDRDRSVEDSELYGSKKNKEKNPTSSKQRTENSNHKPPLPTASQFRKGTYHESLDSVHSLCETSYGLVDVFPVEDRKSALCESLTEINTHSSYDRMSESAASDAVDQAVGQLWDSKAKFVNVSLVVENQSPPRCSNNFETSDIHHCQGRGCEIYFRTKLKHISCIHTMSTPHKHHHRHLHHGGRRRQPQSAQQDPYSLLKEDPVQVLSDLWVRTFSDHNQTPFSNLTGFLSKLDLWVLAYQRTCAHFTGSFPPRNAIQSHVLADLLSLRNAVVHGQYQWNMKTQPYIQNPNEKTPFAKLSSRKLRTISHSGETPFQDTVVQELLLMILEPIFEPRFSPTSHAFRPRRNAHTAIRTIRSNFAGYVWFLKGDLTLIFDHVDVNLLMGFVEKGLKDQKVLSLIRSGLKDLPKPLHLSNEKVYRRKPKKKGLKKKKVLDENEAKPDPYWLRTFYDFAPMEALKVPNYGYCGILSPLLANICLNELDHMIGEKIHDNFVSISNASINDSYGTTTTPSWPEFIRGGGKDKTKKMDYIRYGGHFLIGIRGSRKDAVEIRNAIIEFSTSKYGLTLNESNLHIEHISRGVQFLDHIISQRVIYPKIRFASNGGHIVTQKSIGILLSITASLPQCIRHFRRLKFVKGDKDPDPLPCTPMLYCGQAQTNAQMNKFLETMADWYRYADNRKKVVGFCAYVIRNSVGKLYAARYKMKSRAKVFKKGTRDLSAPLRQSVDNRTPEYADLLRLGFADFIEGIRFSRMCMIPSCDYTPFPRKWVPHHERVLVDYIKLRDLKLFCELQRSVKEQRLRLPQDMLAEIVWDYKTLGARNRCPKFGM